MEISANFGRTLADITNAPQQRTGNTDLDQQDFLKIMVEQMRNQNPLEPQDNGEFFSQIAQFDSLNTMREIVDVLRSLTAFSELANASSLIGRTITATVPQLDAETGLFGDPLVITGVVERVTFEPDGAMVHVDGQPVPAAFISEVAPPPDAEISTEPDAEPVVEPVVEPDAEAA